MSDGGLTSVQEWAHNHIVRCPSCGAWELIEERELRSRTEHQPRPILCGHLRRSFTAEEAGRAMALTEGRATS